MVRRFVIDDHRDLRVPGIMCEGHRRCTVHPVYKVAVHRIDICNKPPGPIAVYRLCPACTRATATRLERIIGEVYETGQTLRCETCNRWIAGLHDVFTVEWVTEVRSA